LELNTIIKGLLEAALSSAKLFMIVAFSMAFAWVMGNQNVPEQIAKSLICFTDNPLVMLLIIKYLIDYYWYVDGHRGGDYFVCTHSGADSH
jgi:TRAP-type C4-dicarboxylate transport system permease large subunit